MSNQPLIEFRNVSKAYGNCHASRGLSFSVTSGTIHGIIGENGAGKSTAMKLLFGMDTPDTGEIRIRDQVANFGSPSEAMSAGVGMVHQHFMLAGPFSAVDQLILSEPGSGFGFLSRTKALKKFTDLANKYGFAMDLTKTVDELPVGAQQRLEILKVLARDPKIIIFDEPTAVLTPAEVQEFFAQVRALKNEGRTILVITHKLREIMQLTDEVTVFRQGSVVGRRKTSETSLEDLAELMMGRKDRKHSLSQSQPGANVLELNQFAYTQGEHGVGPLKLTVREGEIVGVAGVEGNGQDLLIRALVEGKLHSRHLQGEGKILGRSLKTSSTTDLRALGAAFFPEDRLRFGVLENRPARENFLLGLQKQKDFRQGPWIDFQAVDKKIATAFEEFGVEPRDHDLPLGRFSGGNQQKFVVARELSIKPKFILAAQPTRGVDLGAVRFIHEKILEARTNRAGILLISSELEELMDLCDRIVVIYRGKFIAEFARSDFDETNLGLAMGGKV